MHRTISLQMGDLNKFIKCPLCKGYLIDSFMVNECMHTFCKSCIIKYIKRKECCPICKVSISKEKMHIFLRKDVNLQFIVYKLVPNLFNEEMKRRRDFYATRPKAIKYLKRKKMYDKESIGELDAQDIFLYEDFEDISLSIEYSDQGLKEICDSYRVQENPSIPKSFLQCPANLTVKLLKKFLSLKFSLLDMSDIDVMYDEKPLSDDLTLLDIAHIYAWRRTSPMRLFYCKRKADETIKNNLISLTNKLRKSLEINTDKIQHHLNQIPSDKQHASCLNKTSDEENVQVDVKTDFVKKPIDEKFDQSHEIEQKVQIQQVNMTEEVEMCESANATEKNNQNEKEKAQENNLSTAKDESAHENLGLSNAEMVETQKQDEAHSKTAVAPSIIYSNLNDKENEMPLNGIKMEKKLLNENQLILNGTQEPIKSEVENSNDSLLQPKTNPTVQKLKKIKKEPKEKKAKNKLQITDEEEKQNGPNRKRSKKNHKQNDSIEQKEHDNFLWNHSKQQFNPNNSHSFSTNQQTNCILPNSFQFMPYVNQIINASMQTNNCEQHAYSALSSQTPHQHHQPSLSSSVTDSIQKTNNNVMQTLLNQKYVSTLYGYLQSKAQCLQQNNVFSNLNYFKQSFNPPSNHFYYPNQFNQFGSQLNADTNDEQFKKPSSLFVGDSSNAFYPKTNVSSLESLKETQLKISESCNLVNDFN